MAESQGHYPAIPEKEPIAAPPAYSITDPANVQPQVPSEPQEAETVLVTRPQPADNKGHATLCNIICAILLPPVGVSMYKGCAVFDVWVCATLLLTIFGMLPGMIFALFVIFAKK